MSGCPRSARPSTTARSCCTRGARSELTSEGDVAYPSRLFASAYASLLAGEGANTAAFERALSFGVPQRPEWLPLWAICRDDLEQARTGFAAMVERNLDEGNEPYAAFAFADLATIDLWRGRWPDAAKAAENALECAERTGSRASVASALVARGLVDAHLGREAHVRDALERIAAVIDGGEDSWSTASRSALAGFLELSLGNRREADRHYTVADEALEATSLREPARFRFHGDQFEAVVALDQVDRAEQLLGRLEERARVFPRPWIDAICARGRGLLFAARGDLPAAAAALERALGHHAGVDMPFDRARTLLVKGEVHLRRRQKRLARESLEQALAIFDELGARLWAERARTELGRVLPRRAPDELTETERRIAELAAAGRQNREIAQALFVTTATVEFHLRNAYRKLGISGRPGLAQALR
jgi:DNA-binding CsgD family transcriptional regulator